MFKNIDDLQFILYKIKIPYFSIYKSEKNRRFKEVTYIEKAVKVNSISQVHRWERHQIFLPLISGKDGLSGYPLFSDFILI